MQLCGLLPEIAILKGAIASGINVGRMRPAAAYLSGKCGENAVQVTANPAVSAPFLQSYLRDRPGKP